ncbi:MAG TPA: DUF4129 domain-containing protein [Candidatus Limnocylindrales bacterium]
MQVLRRWLPLLAVVALLTAAGAAASMTQLPLTRADQGPLGTGGQLEQRDRPPPPSRGPSDASPDTAVPQWVMPSLIVIGIIIAIVLLGAVFGAAVRTGRRFRRRSLRVRAPAKPDGADVDDQVVAALDAGLQQLDESDADPRRAVIACWVRLEKAAAAAGTPRLAGDTPTDLVLRLLGGHSLSEGLLTRFADVYRKARYASHRVDEGMREQAKAALGQLREELVGAKT